MEIFDFFRVSFENGQPIYCVLEASKMDLNSNLCLPKFDQVGYNFEQKMTTLSSTLTFIFLIPTVTVPLDSKPCALI